MNIINPYIQTKDQIQHLSEEDQEKYNGFVETVRESKKTLREALVLEGKIRDVGKDITHFKSEIEHTNSLSLKGRVGYGFAGLGIILLTPLALVGVVVVVVLLCAPLGGGASSLWGGSSDGGCSRGIVESVSSIFNKASKSTKSFEKRLDKASNKEKVLKDRFKLIMDDLQDKSEQLKVIIEKAEKIPSLNYEAQNIQQKLTKFSEVINVSYPKE